MFKLPVVKVLSRFVNKITITFLADFDPAGVDGVPLYLRLAEYAAWLNGVMTALSVIIILFLVRKDENPAYTIAWMALIGITPVFGGLMYLFWGNKRPSRRMRRRMAAVDRRHRGLVDQRPGQLDGVRPAHPGPERLYRQIRPPGRPGRIPRWNIFPAARRCSRTCWRTCAGLKSSSSSRRSSSAPAKCGTPSRDILREKAAAGVDVRVIYDDMGCLTTVPSGFVIRLEQAPYPLHPL